MQQNTACADAQGSSGKRAQSPAVTYSGLIQFPILIVAIISLILKLKEE